MSTLDLGLSATADLVAGFSLSASVSGNRVNSDPALGRTETGTVSLEPGWRSDRLGLSLRSYLSYSEVSNEVLALDMVNEQMQLALRYGPSWLGSLASFELSTDWSRSRDRALGLDGGFRRRTTASVVLSWDREGNLVPRSRPAPYLAGLPNV